MQSHSKVLASDAVAMVQCCRQQAGMSGAALTAFCVMITATPSVSNWGRPARPTI